MTFTGILNIIADNAVWKHNPDAEAELNWVRHEYMYNTANFRESLYARYDEAYNALPDGEKRDAVVGMLFMCMGLYDYYTVS